MFLHNFPHDSIFFYVTIRDQTYVEPDFNEESNRVEDLIFRIFAKEEDAERYADSIAHYEMEPPQDVFVQHTTLGQLLKIVQIEGPKLKSASGDSLRLDACKMDENEHPETLTTIYRFSTPKYLN